MNDTSNTTALPEGHPVQVYFQEKEMIQTLLEELTATDPNQEIQKYTNIFNQLYTIEKRFARKKTSFSLSWKKKAGTVLLKECGLFTII